ncbi:MAG TPA: hypothetical protein VIF10_02785 [Methylobacter sp.]|jgi:hypothetical protein
MYGLPSPAIKPGYSVNKGDDKNSAEAGRRIHLARWFSSSSFLSRLIKAINLKLELSSLCIAHGDKCWGFLRDGKIAQCCNSLYMSLGPGGAVHWKTASKFCHFNNKERLNFPAANHYYVDIIAHVNFMTGNSALNNGKY